MKKNYILLFIFLLLSNYSFSQTNTTDKSIQVTAGTASVNEEKKTVILSKTQLPSDQKVTQETFYIVNDKPVDRLKYQQHLQETVGKK